MTKKEFQDLLAVVDKLAHLALDKPSLLSNLDEAGKEYAYKYTENDNGNGGEDWEDDIRITFIAGAEWMAKQLPLPEDSATFQKGVQEGRRLEREDALTIADIEKFRREAAKDFTVALVSSGSGLNPKTIAYAIEMADELIKQLKEK